MNPTPYAAASHLKMPTRRLRAAALWVMFVLAVVSAWALAETAILMLLRHPRWIESAPAKMRQNLGDLYDALDRPIIQTDAERARFDSELFYTLRPGHFEYRAREFATHFEVNRLGFRDDAASLEGPAVVVVGDSLAMGWGVEQDETFAQIMERRMGQRVLNAAVASYGTVREMRALNRIDLSRATHLVIQYCENDMFENVPLLRDGHLEYGTSEQYAQALEAHRSRRAYWFGRYTAWLVQYLLASSQSDVSPSLDVHAEAFVNAVQKAAGKPLQHLQLVVVSAWIDGFPEALEEFLGRRPDLPLWIRRMKVVRLPPDTGEFPLDGHWTALGHRRVADALLEAMSAR